MKFRTFSYIAMGNSIVILLFFVIIIIPLCKTVPSASEVYVEQAETITFNGPELQIYCYAGKPKSIIYIWKSVSLEMDIPSDDFVYYEGATADIIRHAYQEKRSSWGFAVILGKQNYFKLNPFSHSCIGFQSGELYSVSLNIKAVDYWKVMLLMTGAVLFFSAKKLAKNVSFYYVCGISFGICTSFLVLIYFLSKLFPRKPIMYGVAVCGWTVGAYLIRILFENIRTIFLSYKNFVAGYLAITGLISFIICYRWGPVTNKRTQNLIQWSLQFLAIVTVFQSSQFEEAAMAQIVILFVIYYFPETWLFKSRSYWKKMFPPKLHRMTLEEYNEQGVIETSKALDELRDFCSSPKCDRWKTSLQLNDPKRFASFVLGNSHLSDEEMLEYKAIHATDAMDEEL